MSKTRIGVLYGGRSGEHDVSCVSGLSVLRALDPARFEAVPIGITRDGRFVVPPRATVEAAVTRVRSGGPAIDDALSAEGEEVWLVPGKQQGSALVVAAGSSSAGTLAELDVVFPVLHGPFGEDGSVQGAMEVLGVPYVGSGVLGSAVGMDKVAMKRAFAAEGLPQVPYVWRDEARWRRAPDAAAIVEALGLPLFVKPANLGSSVGVSKVENVGELPAAIDRALSWDHVVVVESGVVAREVECGVLGGLEPEASLPGEIVVSGPAFYDFDAKYVSDGAATVVPAELPSDVVESVRRLAVEAFEAVGCWGLARVDFFYVEDDSSLYVNEVNTIPGFTSISMFAKLWEASGVPYAEQVERLVELAFVRHELMRRRGGAAH